MNKVNYDGLTFDKFKELAASEELSRHEKVGFPDDYREGREETIFSDVLSKLSLLGSVEKKVLEIGPGCSRLPMLLAEVCCKKSHDLYFIDSEEMLALLPEGRNIHKWPGRYPDDMDNFLSNYSGKIDFIIAYSVVQYIYTEGNIWDFLDRTLSLLSPGGLILLGDIPNISMRKRFFSSENGVRCHQEYTSSNELPKVCFNKIELGHIDDSVVLALLTRARNQGFHAWVVPQGANLPMANRREDILIRRP